MTTLSPLKSIRANCLECSNGSAHEVRHCAIHHCPSWFLRFGKRPETMVRRTDDGKTTIKSDQIEHFSATTSKQRRPLKVIRQHCLECMGGNPYEVKLCHIKTCTLHPYRFGKNLNRRRALSEEEKMVLRERMVKAQIKKRKADAAYT